MKNDVFLLYAEIIEITEKSIVPYGDLEENPSGELLEINPEDYGKKELASKDVLFEVTVQEVSKPSLPELNEEFFKSTGIEVSSLEEYKQLKDALQVPVLANITEFGKTPLFTADELASVGVDIMLFPLSAFRAMNKAAEYVYKDIAANGSQQNSIDSMQTRDELYEYLNYHSFEQKLDELFKRKENQ